MGYPAENSAPDRYRQEDEDAAGDARRVLAGAGHRGNHGPHWTTQSKRQEDPGDDHAEADRLAQQPAQPAAQQQRGKPGPEDEIDHGASSVVGMLI